MYRKYPSGEITIWCDGYCEEDACGKRKRDDSSGGPSKRQKKEDKADVVFPNLKEKHGDDFSTPQLRM